MTSRSTRTSFTGKGTDGSNDLSLCPDHVQWRTDVTTYDTTTPYPPSLYLGSVVIENPRETLELIDEGEEKESERRVWGLYCQGSSTFHDTCSSVTLAIALLNQEGPVTKRMDSHDP